jgi:hypothetical protein
MKRWAILSFLLLIFAFSAMSQTTRTKGLVLTGTIIDLGVTSECQGKNGRVLVQAELAMQFRNDTDRRLIVFKPDGRRPLPFAEELPITRVYFLPRLPSISDKQSVRVEAKDIRTNNCIPPRTDYFGFSDPISWYVRQIDSSGPFDAFFEIIEPGGYYSFAEVVTLDTGFELDVKLGRSLREARILSEFPAFQIEYHLSLKGNEKGEGLLRTLQTRWKSYGDLFLDDNGDFTVTSEPIINRTTG